METDEDTNQKNTLKNGPNRGVVTRNISWCPHYIPLEIPRGKKKGIE